MGKGRVLFSAWLDQFAGSRFHLAKWLFYLAKWRFYLAEWLFYLAKWRFYLAEWRFYLATSLSTSVGSPLHGATRRAGPDTRRSRATERLFWWVERRLLGDRRRGSLSERLLAIASRPSNLLRRSGHDFL